VLPFVAAGVAPVLASQAAPEWIGPALLASAALMGGVVGSALAWRRGLDAGALVPLVAAVGVVVAIGYGAIAPGFNRL
jgi:hypothetical protein